MIKATMIVNNKEISVGDRIKFRQKDKTFIRRVRVVDDTFSTIEVLHMGDHKYCVYKYEIIEVYNSSI